MSSSSNSDTSVEMEVVLLDTDYNQITIKQTVNGSTKTAVGPANGFRVISLINIGSVLQVGDVVVYGDSTTSNGVPDDLTKLLAVSTVEKQQCGMAVYTVPKGKQAQLLNINVSGTRTQNSGSLDADLYIRTANGVPRIIGERGVQTAGESSVNYDFPVPVTFEAGTDMYITATSAVSNYDVSGGFVLLIEDVK